MPSSDATAPPVPVTGAPDGELIARNADGDRDAFGRSEHAESEWLSRRVHRALEALSVNEERLSLNVPLGTVKTRTRSALGRLAVVLERDDL